MAIRQKIVTAQDCEVLGESKQLCSDIGNLFLKLDKTDATMYGTLYYISGGINDPMG